MDVKMTGFCPLNTTDELWKAYFDHADAIHLEIDQEDPPLPREKRKGLIRSSFEVPFVSKYMYLALAGDGEAAGYLSVTVENEKSPSYQANKHVGKLYLSVLAKYRRKGLGTRLLKHITAELAAKEPAVTEFLMPVVLESGRNFLGRAGGTVSLVQAENRLYLEELDWGMVEAWAREGVGKNLSTDIITVSAIPEADIKSYSEVYTETMNQQPFGDVSLKIKVTPEQIRLHEENNSANGVEHLTIYTRERDGGVSGLTEINYLKESGHKATQMLTGVRSASRGRGLGKLLKARMLLHIRKEYPGVKYVVTGNADSNEPMMAINNKLGFKKHRPVLLYKLKIK